MDIATQSLQKETQTLWYVFFPYATIEVTRR